jgi:hypothetical protein
VRSADLRLTTYDRRPGDGGPTCQRIHRPRADCITCHGEDWGCRQFTIHAQSETALRLSIMAINTFQGIQCLNPTNFRRVLVMICAYAASFFVTERLFVLLKPKLLTLRWVAMFWSWFVVIRTEVLRWLRRKWTSILFRLGAKL